MPLKKHKLLLLVSTIEIWTEMNNLFSMKAKVSWRINIWVGLDMTYPIYRMVTCHTSSWSLWVPFVQIFSYRISSNLMSVKSVKIGWCVYRSTPLGFLAHTNESINLRRPLGCKSKQSRHAPRSTTCPIKSLLRNILYYKIKRLVSENVDVDAIAETCLLINTPQIEASLTNRQSRIKALNY